MDVIRSVPLGDAGFLPRCEHFYVEHFPASLKQKSVGIFKMQNGKILDLKFGIKKF